MTKDNNNSQEQRTLTVEEQVSINRQLLWNGENEVSSGITKLKQIKNDLERAYIAQTAKQLKELVDRENGQVTERDFIIFLNDLSASLRDTWR